MKREEWRRDLKDMLGKAGLVHPRGHKPNPTGNRLGLDDMEVEELVKSILTYESSYIRVLNAFRNTEAFTLDKTRALCSAIQNEMRKTMGVGWDNSEAWKGLERATIDHIMEWIAPNQDAQAPAADTTAKETCKPRERVKRYFFDSIPDSSATTSSPILSAAEGTLPVDDVISDLPPAPRVWFGGAGKNNLRPKSIEEVEEVEVEEAYRQELKAHKRRSAFLAKNGDREGVQKEEEHWKSFSRISRNFSWKILMDLGVNPSSSPKDNDGDTDMEGIPRGTSF